MNGSHSFLWGVVDRPRVAALLVLLSALLMGAANVLAQESQLAAALDDGISALKKSTLKTSTLENSTLQNSTLDSAIVQLGFVYEQDPSFTGPAGTAAYWLGLALRQTGNKEQARRTWREGILSLQEKGIFDAQLGDAFVVDVASAIASGQSDPDNDLRMASAVFSFMVEQLGPYVTPAAGPILNRHLRELTPIVPKSVRETTGIRRGKPDVTQLSPGAGARLAVWLRSLDQTPATRDNERVAEHLVRVATAKQRFGYEDTYDDRGEIFIKLGEPGRVSNVDFDRSGFRNKVVDRSLTLNMYDFPTNEIWVYEHVDETAHFLFVKKGERFRLAEVRDLVPSSLRTGVAPTTRGKEKAKALVWTMEEIYEQLALQHADYATRYQDVANFAGMIEEDEFAKESASIRQRARSDTEIDPTLNEDVRAAMETGNSGGAAGSSLPGGSFGADRPDLFVRSAMNNAVADDDRIARSRDERLPASYNDSLQGVDSMPVAYRTARFLEADGSTRTEIYWGVTGEALGPSATDRVIIASTVQYSETYFERIVSHDRTSIGAIDGIPEETVLPRALVARGDTGLFHIGLQWDLHDASVAADGTISGIGGRTRAFVTRLDSLRALDSDEDTLVMSDLKPLVATDESLVGEAADGSQQANPSAGVSRSEPLRLYFELYHLLYGAEEKTHYEIEYEVREEGRRRRRDRSTSASATYDGESRTAAETIEIDLSEWGGGDAVVIRLVATDLTDGRTVEREARFELF